MWGCSDNDSDDDGDDGNLYCSKESYTENGNKLVMINSGKPPQFSHKKKRNTKENLINNLMDINGFEKH